jgi:hypothetical protein
MSENLISGIRGVSSRTAPIARSIANASARLVRDRAELSRSQRSNAMRDRIVAVVLLSTLVGVLIGSVASLVLKLRPSRLS